MTDTLTPEKREEIPTGAIENGREFIRRLEDFYTFQHDGHTLATCAEWQELQRCFDALVVHVTAQSSALEAARSANRPRDDYPVFCSDCGRAHVLDTVLPSEIWNKIASPEDLLCVVCIDTRLKKAGLTAEAEFYYSGDSLRSRLYGDADAIEAAEARLSEVLDALGLMLREHDILSGNFGDVMDPKHKRPDRWPTAAEAARRVLEGGKSDE